MRLVWLFGLSILLLQNLSPQQDTKRGHPEAHSEKTAEDSQQRMQVINIESSGCPRNDDHQTKQSASEQSPPSFWKRPSITDWIIAFTTLCYAVISGFMLHALKRQTHIAEMNTSTLIDAERAWFDIDVFEGPTNVKALSITNYGKTHGILTDFTIVYARMTQAQYDELPGKLEKDDMEWEANIKSTQSIFTGGLLLPKKPYEVHRIDVSSFLKEREKGLIDVFYFRVDYETMGHPCWTEVVFLAVEKLLPDPHFTLLNVPGLTHYD